MLERVGLVGRDAAGAWRGDLGAGERRAELVVEGSGALIMGEGGRWPSSRILALPDAWPDVEGVGGDMWGRERRGRSGLVATW